MYIDLTPSQRRLRDELRAYFAELVTDDAREEFRKLDGGGPEYTRILKRLASDGWLGIGWPKEYGGQARSMVDQFLFFDEVQRAGYPIPFLTLCTVGPTLIKFGTDAQKERYLPRILRGELHFSIGYTEPGAGTDLASLKTRAVKHDDGYVVDGQKIFTSLADHADYIWLAVRTDPAAPKHKGISVLIVDTKSPGFSKTPIHTLGGNRTSATYFEGVRVPAENLVGKENEGWRLITSQLNHERVALSSPGPVAIFVEQTLAWAKEQKLSDGRRLIDLPWVRENLARARQKMAVLELMTWRQAWRLDRGDVDPAEASTIKVYGSEQFIQIYQLLHEVFGQAGYLKAGSPGAVLRGRIEQYYRTTLVLTFGGGVNEVQRDIIAAAGLRMPRGAR